MLQRRLKMYAGKYVQYDMFAKCRPLLYVGRPLSPFHDNAINCVGEMSHRLDECRLNDAANLFTHPHCLSLNNEFTSSQDSGVNAVNSWYDQSLQFYKELRRQVTVIGVGVVDNLWMGDDVMACGRSNGVSVCGQSFRPWRHGEAKVGCCSCYLLTARIERLRSGSYSKVPSASLKQRSCD